MKMFIWQRLLQLTNHRYHSAGGLMVVASSLEEARALCAGSGRLLHDGDFLSDEPDQVIPLAPEYQPQGGRIWVYPDVGGCDE